MLNRRGFVQAAALTGVLCASAPSPAAARALRLVVLGDSLAAGYGLPRGDTFPDQLQGALRAKGWAVEVINAGVSGDTAEDGLARYEWAVPPDADALVVELGANDMLRGLDPAMTRKVLGEIIARLQARKIKVLLAGMLATPSLGADYVSRFNAIYPSLGQQYGVPVYPFFLDGIAGDPKLNLTDGLHPNRAGVEVIVAHIEPAVEALLRQLPSFGRLLSHLVTSVPVA